MAVTINDTLSIQLENVRPVLEKIFEQSDQIAGKVKKSTKAQAISRYLYRMPFSQYVGGTYSKFNANGGSLPSGSSMKTGNLVAGYFYSVLAFRLNQEQIDTTQNTEQAIQNVMSYTLANGMEEQKVLDDIAFHQPGNGILTNASSATNGTTTLTFASATDFIGINRLREGMAVGVWDATGATERAAGTSLPIVIIDIDYEGKVVTFNQTVTSLTATDIISFQGMAAYGPSTLTTYSSSYPGTPPITGNGIGGDSFRHGFPYMTNATGTNYFYGILKSSLGQMTPVRVNAANLPLEWDHFQRMISKVMQKRDGDNWKKLVGIAHMTQRAAVFGLGMAISTRFVNEKQGVSYDGVPSNQGYEEVFDAAGIPCYLSKRQATDRIDFIQFDKIERAQLFDTRYHEIGGKYLFEGRDTNGAVAAYLDFFVEQAYDYACVDCGGFGSIDTLALPSAAWS